MTRPETNIVRGYSVAELVHIRATGGGAAWQLSLVQRGAVWDALKVRYLLDSLLAGYPVGSLLLCRVARGGGVLVSQGGLRVHRDADDSVLQLLDGQQRMNALAQLFSRETASGPRFFLRLDAMRDMDDVIRSRTRLDKSLSYIEDHAEAPALPDRWRWLDLSLLHAASQAGRVPDIDGVAALSDEAALQLAQQVDPDCKRAAWESVDPSVRVQAGQQVRRLLRCWRSPAIAVVELRLDGPTDVLQVFNRVNRTGTSVSNDDMFFAAVRTLWNDAEEHIERVRQCSPLLSRIGTLRLVARLAAHEVSKTDIVPLDIDKLGGDAGRQLIKHMETLCEVQGPLVRSVTALSRSALTDSGLGYGLRQLSEDALAPLFAWAFKRDPATLQSNDLAPAWSFLLGTECFRYRQVFGDAFKRHAFADALSAGESGAPFPLQAIAKRCQLEWLGLAKGRQRVQHLSTTPEQPGTPLAPPGPRRQLVNANAALLLAVVQDIPYTLPDGRELDVEHLYPQARKNAMKWKGPADDKHSCQHPSSWDSNRAGNLCWLDAALNRAAQDDWPETKLERYRKAAWTPPLFLSAEEEQLLVSACQKLRGKDGAGWESDPKRDAALSVWVGDAMHTFAEYVQRRELRIFAEITGRYPDMLLFAAMEPPDAATP
jgi:hypothetical protein